MFIHCSRINTAEKYVFLILVTFDLVIFLKFDTQQFA
jgi:hypothetical protein